LDDYLRGLQGNPSSLILWNQLIYGTPPTGLDVRLSIDLTLQSTADKLLGDHRGAVILMNADTGEILVMASHPTYDPNKLTENSGQLLVDENSPLLNRAAQGLYPLGDTALPLLRAQFGDKPPPNLVLESFYKSLGFYTNPIINMPVAAGDENPDVTQLRVSPLQVCIAISALSHGGILPAPRIATAVNTPEQGWVVLPALDSARRVLQATAAAEAAASFVQDANPFWSHTAQAVTERSRITWFVAGTPPDWQGAPLALVVVLEENNPNLAQRIGEELFNAGLNE
jgi:hypothetical protein